MEAEQEFGGWQDMLAKLIKTPQEKRRLAQDSELTIITLERWAEKKSEPREYNLRQLVRAMRLEHAPLFLQLIQQAYPDFRLEGAEDGKIVPEISSELYAQVLQLYAKTPPALARQRLMDVVLRNAIEQLDPNRIGMVIGLVCCVPPRPGQKVRALRQIGGIGNPPWDRDQERNTLFLGFESRAGEAVTQCHAVEVKSREDTSSLVHWTPNEHSAVACPILRQAKIAGALVASSKQPYYFTPEHTALFVLFARLSVLMFEADEFYDPNEIMLERMPDFNRQQP